MANYIKEKEKVTEKQTNIKKNCRKYVAECVQINNKRKYILTK